MAPRFQNTPRVILCCLSAAFVFCGAAFMHAPLFVKAQSAEEDEFPEGLTEEEKQKMLDEMYRDIENDESPSPDTSLNTLETMTDEEAREKIEEMLPSEEELEKMTEDYSEHVMPIASFSTAYEVKNGLYRYILPGGSGIAMSTPLGGWANHAVALLVDPGISVVAVMKDGEKMLPGDDGSYFFRDHGRYSFIVYEDEADERCFLAGGFRIVSSQMPVTDSFFPAPEGYRLLEVRVGGTPVGISNAKWIELSRDGLYEVTCEADVNGAFLPETISTSFVRDTTPPVIEWEGNIVDGRFRGNVYYTVEQPDTEVSILYNGQPAVSETHILAAEGNYFITATDPAGNVRVYNFVLVQNVSLPWGVIFAILGGMLVIAVILVATSGRGMRVR